MRPKLIIALASALAIGSTVLADESNPPGRLPLRILYAGNEGSDRAENFAAFLGEHFAKVTIAPLASFKPEDAQDHDVVIFDWTSIYPRDKDGKIDNSVGNIATPQAPALPQTFSRPTILIGAAGGQVAGHLQIKINWL